MIRPESGGAGARPATLPSRSMVSNGRTSPPVFAMKVAARTAPKAGMLLGRGTDPATGRRHIVNAFAMVLCCSRHMFVRPVLAMDQRARTECHVAAFGFFGGAPARLVPDNLKTGAAHPA
jgi:hypothetical protein